MTQYKTSELSGAHLDAAVALAEGMTVVEMRDPQVGSRGRVCDGVLVRGHPACRGQVLFSPTLDYRDGRDIVERERIATWYEGGEWCAAIGDPVMAIEVNGPKGKGPTSLIAALRAYVAIKIGKEVDMDFPLRP